MRPRAASRGFTLIELVTVVAIMTLITTAILLDTQQFNSSILLRSLAYEVGLSLREAQLYGVAVKETGAGTNKFNAAYGVYFPATLVGVRRGTYPLFIDSNANGIYDEGASSIVENFTLQNNFAIAGICGTSGGALTCAGACPNTLPSGATSCTPDTLQWVVVSFHRPDPDAIILGLTTNNSTLTFSSALVSVISQTGDTRAVSISSTGQIVVEGGQ